MFALLAQPGAILGHGIDLFAIVVRHRVADRVETRICAVSNDVGEEVFVALLFSRLWRVRGNEWTKTFFLVVGFLAAQENQATTSNTLSPSLPPSPLFHLTTHLIHLLCEPPVGRAECPVPQHGPGEYPRDTTTKGAQPIHDQRIEPHDSLGGVDLELGEVGAASDQAGEGRWNL